jgi:DNA repair protein RecN (Recombination protein N)
MLRNLAIRDMLLIDRLELAFRPGLNVLTGETGAGKSILLDCLGFVLGWRGRAELARAGAAQGEVAAEFALEAAHPARAVLAEAGIPAADGALLIRRTVAADGRKTAYVNDRRAGAELLRALADRLVELHGQRDDRGLMDPRGHRGLLDAFAGAAGALAAVRAAARDVQAARRELAAAETALAAAAAEEDWLRHTLAELDRLAPAAGEEAALDSRRRAMQQALRVREEVARALAALSGAEGAEGRVAEAARRLAQAAGRAAEALGDRLDPALGALDRAGIEIGEAAAGIEAALGALDIDQGALEATEERLFAIRAAARKHGVAADDLAGHAAGLRARLQAIDNGARDLAARRAALAAAEAAQAAACAVLTALRRAAAARLDAAMAAELPPLKLDRARFETVLAPAAPGPDGAEEVRFCVATNPGAPAGPIDRIASGGELARFLLALKVCLSAGQAGVTLIFDEIDRGVGGATADAVGRRLEALARGAQVLVVTHSPQVAARAAHHWRVEKRLEAGRARSTVVPLDAAGREAEVARMLAGERVTDAARAAAAALIAGAG